MTNCWACQKTLVRYRSADGRLETACALRKRQTCHENPECYSALMDYRKLQWRIKHAKRHHESPDIAELFTRGIRLITMRVNYDF